MDNLEIDPSLLEEVLEEAEQQEANEPPSSLEELCIRIMDVIEEYDLDGAKRSIMLTEGGNYTVVRPDGLYRKKALVGGEEFTLYGAYAGKDGKTLYWVLKPTFPCDFTVMHVPEADQHLLAGISVWTEGELKDLLAERKSIFQQQQAEAERAVIGSRDKYKAMGFGTW